MRSLVLTMALLTASVGTAQQPMPMPPTTPTQPNVPPPTADDPQLNQLLLAWEAKMKQVESLAVECHRLEDDKLFAQKTTFVGKAFYLKPNLAILDMAKQGGTEAREYFVSDGNNLYEYRFKNKLVLIHKLPKNQNGVGNDTFLSFLFGMKAEEAKERYHMQINRQVSNEWWLYIDIIPRYVADRQEFSRAQLVLYAQPGATQYLPRRLWFEQPNKNEVTWEFPRVQVNQPLQRESFRPPTLPMGWTTQEAAKPEATPTGRPQPK